MCNSKLKKLKQRQTQQYLMGESVRWSALEKKMLFQITHLQRELQACWQ